MTCEMTPVCIVHKNIDVCVSSQLLRFKIAIAFALIRIKPVGQSMKEFITDLQLAHQNKVCSVHSFSL